MMMRLSQAVAIVALATQFGVVSSASAQEAEAKALLEASAAAIEKLDSFTAKINLAGEGSSSFTPYMPSADAVFKIRRGDVETGWQTRVTGEAKDRQDAESAPFDIVQDRSKVTWVDHKNKNVVTAATNRAKGIGLSMQGSLHLDEWLGERPLSRELAAQGFEVLEDEEIGGVMCDVVRVDYGDSDGKFPRAGSTPPNKATIYLGSEDHLPRKIVRTTDAGIVALGLVTTLTDVRVNPGLEASGFEVAAPEGYQVKEMKTATPRRVTQRATPAQAKPQRVGNQRAQAPGFEMTTLEGETVTLASQEGRLTVLYYWGTWCIPCREFSPLISELAAALEGEPVDVYAPAVKSTERKVRETMEKKAYKHTALVNADAAATAHKIRTYPSIVLIDEKGGLVTVETHGGGRSAAETVGEIERAVRAELERMNG